MNVNVPTLAAAALVAAHRYVTLREAVEDARERLAALVVDGDITPDDVVAFQTLKRDMVAAAQRAGDAHDALPVGSPARDAYLRVVRS